MLGVVFVLASHDFVAHVTRLGGDTATAQPFIDKFCRYVEGKMGWDPNSVTGKFFPSRGETLRYIDEKKPSFGMLEPPVFAELKNSKKLEQIVQIQSKDLNWGKLNLVSKGGQSLDALKGKTLCAVGADSPDFLSKSVFGGKVDAAKHFQLKPVTQQIKGVRSVLKGECDATLLDDDSLAAVGKLEGGAELKAGFTSAPLPATPLVSFGKAVTPAEKKKLADVLMKMCDDTEGKTICADMRVEKFVAPK